MIGALVSYITDPGREHFQPVNANFGILPSLPGPMKKKDKKARLAERALADMKNYLKEIEV